jgi:hypothetical protein
MEEALGEIIPFIITVILYALRTTLDIVALGIILLIGGLHRYFPIKH